MDAVRIDESSPREINLSWLVRLRWAAVAGQSAAIVAVERGLGIELPLGALGALIAVAAATNLAAALLLRAGHPVPSWLTPALMSADILLFTGMLYLTGGPSNPFSFLYLVQIAMAAIVLSPRWTWALVALSMASSGLLFLAHRPLAITHDEHMRLHLEGMWVAYGVAAAFIVYFLMRITGALAAREAELAQARSLAARHEKVAALATLAAGAAHELGTPLSTIAVAAKELERNLGRAGNALTDEASDARLIRQEVQRCRAVLDRMAADAGEAAGEMVVDTTLDELVRLTLESLPDAPPVRVDLGEHSRTRALRLPERALARALRVLLRNAQDASGRDSEVLLRAELAENGLLFEVCDRGKGMGADVLARAGEPFFTTKEAGQGMGLGLFLARTVIERIGGRLELESKPGHGTSARVSFPLGAASGPAEGPVAAEGAG